MTGSAPPVRAARWLAAWRGQEEAVEPFDPGARARVVLENGRGRAAAALAAAQRVGERTVLDDPWLLPELVEAAVRSGRREAAVAALRRLDERPRAGPSEFALGTAARCRALVGRGRAAEELYREAIERLGRTPFAPHLARSHLVYGEWLQRERRRREAGAHLRAAHELLAGVGAWAFAERAARELPASAARPRRRGREPRGQLTAQERQIAALACAGRSNSEIGAQLFISPRTVEYHLGKVFGKLAISSRSELAGVLPADPPAE